MLFSGQSAKLAVVAMAGQHAACASGVPAKNKTADVTSNNMRMVDSVRRCRAGKQAHPALQREQSTAAGHFTVIARPFRSALTIAPTELPVSESTAPFALVSTIACAPPPSAAPTFPAA